MLPSIKPSNTSGSVDAIVSCDAVSLPSNSLLKRGLASLPSPDADRAKCFIVDSSPMGLRIKNPVTQSHTPSDARFRVSACAAERCCNGPHSQLTLNYSGSSEEAGGIYSCPERLLCHSSPAFLRPSPSSLCLRALSLSLSIFDHVTTNQARLKDPERRTHGPRSRYTHEPLCAGNVRALCTVPKAPGAVANAGWRMWDKWPCGTKRWLAMFQKPLSKAQVSHVPMSVSLLAQS